MLRNNRSSPRQQVSPPRITTATSSDRSRPAAAAGAKEPSTKRGCYRRVLLALSVIATGSLLVIFIPSGSLYLGDLPASLELLELSLTSSSESPLPAAPIITAKEKASSPEDSIEIPIDVETIAPVRQELSESQTTKTIAMIADDDPDANCPFRDSPLYRKVYVYPTYGQVDQGWSGPILSDAGRNLTALQPWPWLRWERESKKNATSHYDIDGQHVQYATELLVRDIITHPDSCLRTNNPDEATLFYVPYLPSVEHHQGSKRINDMSQSLYGQAIMDILEGKYQAWEDQFGLTSKYWKRRKGADHILVFSEPMHGLWHPRSRRGNFHFINSQKQLDPPIVISVELSTSFVEMYPKCAAKNILVPYPNTDGRWLNGYFEKEAAELLDKANVTVTSSQAALPAERKLSEKADPSARPVAQFYAAGNHGTCTKLRRAMQKDYKQCSASAAMLKSKLSAKHAVGMRHTTFCPCPGGDSPSAKRMFDALLAGCIPIILSHDFVWPLTNEFDPLIPLSPLDFSIRLLAEEYDQEKLDESSCLPKNTTSPGLQIWMDGIPESEIQRLRKGVEMARDLYGYYKPRADGSLPDNPLREGVLPDGGAAHALVKALADRASGVRWPACKEELKKPRETDPRQFKC